MNVTVIGAGYVGLATGLLCAKQGHSVHFVDLDESRIEDLKSKHCYLEVFKEPFAEFYSLLSFDTKHKYDPDVVFCCVNTPSTSEGLLDMAFFDSAIQMCPKNTIFVQRSTCLPGTADKYAGLFQDYIVVPEFLREKTAWEDTLHPDRIVVGAGDEELYARYNDVIGIFVYTTDKIAFVDPVEAELIKLVSNAFLATKISFASMVTMLCDRYGADAEKVLLSVGADSRIGQAMFRYDGGFAGACLPKDTKALAVLCEDNLLEAVLDVNDRVRNG